MAFYCNGKKGVCECDILCADCKFYDNSGGKKVQTNGDCIRAMSDNELAHFMAERNVNESTLPLLNKDHGLTDIQIEERRHTIYCALMRWLKQPAGDQ